MQAVQTGMIVGVMMVTLMVALTAVIFGRRVRSTDDFTVAGRRAGWPVVSGIIVVPAPATIAPMIRRCQAMADQVFSLKFRRLAQIYGY